MLFIQMTLEDVQIILSVDRGVIHYQKIWHELSWPLDKLMIKLA